MKKAMFGKKKDMEGCEMDPIEKESKMSAITAMKKMAEDEMSGKLSGLKKVTVASDSSGGITKGLDKAKDLVESAGDEEIEEALEGSSEEESPEEETSEEGEFDNLSETEIDAKLEELLALKEKMKMP